MKAWFINLNDVPTMTSLYYICTKCVIGMNHVLEITKSDNRYRLHQANHIIDVEVCQDPDTTYSFITLIFNYICILIYMYLFSSPQCKPIKARNDDA